MLMKHEHDTKAPSKRHRFKNLNSPFKALNLKCMFQDFLRLRFQLPDPNICLGTLSLKTQVT